MKLAKVAAVGFSLAAGAVGALLAPSADAAREADKISAAAAANAFLKSLPKDLRSAASFPGDSPERLAWHFIPKERVGASLLKLDDTQSDLLGPHRREFPARSGTRGRLQEEPRRSRKAARQVQLRRIASASH